MKLEKQHSEENTLVAVIWICKRDGKTQKSRILELLNVKTNS
jgi:hypothetical protein